MVKRNVRYSINELLFIIAYTLFMLSYFFLDIEQNTFDFLLASSLIRYASLIIGILGVLVLERMNVNSLKTFIFVFAFGLFSFAFTHSTFFMGVGILSIYAYKSKDDRIINLSLKIILIATITVILLQFGGVFENVITKRWLYSEDAGRNSFGFGHSNILPLNYMYVTAYILILKNQTIKARHLFGLSLIALIIYLQCDSRNALLVTLLMCILVLFKNSMVNNRRLQTAFGFLARHIFSISVMFSIFGALLLTKIPILNQVNYLLSDRLFLAKKMIETFGIHFVAHLETDVYFQNAIVIDNGYLFISIRYGLLYVVFLAIISFFLGKRVQHNVILCIIMVAIAMANIIDNDLFDYSCLPFLIIGIKATFSKKIFYLKNRVNTAQEKKQYER